MISISDVVKKAKENNQSNDLDVNKKASLKDELKRSVQPNSFNKIQYTRTKVVPVSNETLTNNRIVAQNKEDPASVPFAMLRARVLRELRDNGWNNLAISAPTAGAGKSLVAVNLAMSISMEANQTVLLVDMDLRQPSVHTYFSLEPEYGVQDYLERDISLADIMINPGVERLSIIPGRKRVINSSETLALPQVKSLTEELSGRYDSRIIIYDLPPYLVSDDAMVFLPSVDCSLLVVESGVSTKEEIEESIKMASVKPLIGTVLNKEVEGRKLYVY